MEPCCLLPHPLHEAGVCHRVRGEAISLKLTMFGFFSSPGITNAPLEFHNGLSTIPSTRIPIFTGDKPRLYMELKKTVIYKR